MHAYKHTYNKMIRMIKSTGDIEIISIHQTLEV